MRTLVDIPDAELRELGDLAKKQARPRASLIREAVADLLAKRRAERLDDAFGF